MEQLVGPRRAQIRRCRNQPLSAPGQTTQNASLLLLSVAAGCVDAIAFVRSGIFPANMSGNSVVLAIGILHPETGAAALSALALAGFCLGAASGAWLVHAPDRDWSRRISGAILLAGLLVLACAATLLLAPDRFFSAVIIVVSAAMGLQSAAIQQLGIPGVATVFVTGTLTATIARLVGLARRMARGEPRTGASPWLPASSWAGYFIGAIIGGMQVVSRSAIPVILPGVLLVAVAAVTMSRLPRNR
jgi:uncharacterized membrane protein YoaK (UPF0700 family)